MPTQLRPRSTAALCCALAAACGPAPADEAGDAADPGVEVLPAAPQVFPRSTVAFMASVGGAMAAVTWSIQEGTSGGSITSGGLYTAPGIVGQYHVIATPTSSPGTFGSATVTVTATPVVQVTVTPRTPSVAVGGSVAFSASVTGASDTGVSWTVQEGPAGGAVSGSGVYTAPGAPGTYHVVATSVADGTKSDTATVTVTAPPADLATQLAVLSGKAIYFGHRSVGGNVMDGVRTLLAANAGPEPTVVTTSSAASMGAGIWAEALNGENFDPIGKLDAFRTTIDGGVGAEVDIAFMKFCWVDFDDESLWFQGGGDSAGLFARYQSAMAALRAAHPGVKLVHFTAPLFTDTIRNQRREAYNTLVRSTYGGVEPVFDLARLESTDPSGNRVIGTYGPALYGGYTTDGGHLNAAGEDKVARALVALLAGL
jgi:archaellum component FlaG (FlaF/FlaG flagellin family)